MNVDIAQFLPYIDSNKIKLSSGELTAKVLLNGNLKEKLNSSGNIIIGNLSFNGLNKSENISISLDEKFGTSRSRISQILGDE